MVKCLFSLLEITSDEVIIQFVEKQEIGKIHASHFNDPSPTDCISFPIDASGSPSPSVLGEVFVCPQVAIDYGKDHHIDPYEETTRYVIHGILHLIGYDDLTEDDRDQMKTQENSCLKTLTEKKLLISQ